MDLSQYSEIFLAESKEHLGAINGHLLEWELNREASEPVGAIFRAMHTVKGMAATMGYQSVADLAHRSENLTITESVGRSLSGRSKYLICALLISGGN